MVADASELIFKFDLERLYQTLSNTAHLVIACKSGLYLKVASRGSLKAPHTDIRTCLKTMGDNLQTVRQTAAGIANL